MDAREQGTTTHPVVWLMVDAVNHVTPETGLAPTVTISKDGAAFAPPVGAVSEIGNGWYQLVGNAGDRDTLGELIVHAVATGADPADVRVTIVAFDPFDVNLALPRLDATVSSRAIEATVAKEATLNDVGDLVVAFGG